MLQLADVCRLGQFRHDMLLGGGRNVWAGSVWPWQKLLLDIIHAMGKSRRSCALVGWLFMPREVHDIEACKPALRKLTPLQPSPTTILTPQLRGQSERVRHRRRRRNAYLPTLGQITPRQQTTAIEIYQRILSNHVIYSILYSNCLSMLRPPVRDTLHPRTRLLIPLMP